MRKEPIEVRRQAVFTLTVITVGIIIGIYIVLRIGMALMGGPDAPTSTIAAPYEAR